ncbi:hypothetical protein [Streptomyces kanamyceticus]|uniref:hypothetical protein n=1 Tax=Streptomyces kanamyceticus TaxID=1967 RepID=UPI0037DD807E
MLELITDILALSQDALWAVDINHGGGAALPIGLLLSHEQPMVISPAWPCTTRRRPIAARARGTRRTPQILVDKELPNDDVKPLS